MPLASIRLPESTGCGTGIAQCKRSMGPMLESNFTTWRSRMRRWWLVLIVPVVLTLTGSLDSREAKPIRFHTPPSSLNDALPGHYDLLASASGRRWIEAQPNHWRAYMLSR
jgi:hypothetical protein